MIRSTYRFLPQRSQHAIFAYPIFARLSLTLVEILCLIPIYFETVVAVGLTLPFLPLREPRRRLMLLFSDGDVGPGRKSVPEEGRRSAGATMSDEIADPSDCPAEGTRLRYVRLGPICAVSVHQTLRAKEERVVQIRKMPHFEKDGTKGENAK